MNKRRKQQAMTAPVALILGALAWLFFGILGVAAFSLILTLFFGGWEAVAAGRIVQRKTRRIEVRRTFWLGLLLPFGLVLLFVAERVVGRGDELVWAWRGLASVCLAAAVGWRAYEVARSTGRKRTVELGLAAATGGVILALGLYALGSSWGTEALGLEGEAQERTSGVLSALWPALLVVSWSALFFMEMAYRVMPIEESIEVRRVMGAGSHGAGLALSFVFVVSINYVAREREVREDLSYLQTTRPSETTLERVRALDEPIRVVLLFPRVNEVLERVRPYFDEIGAASGSLTVEVMDHALSPELMRQHRVRGNGFVLLVRGEGEGAQAESFEVGTELEAARSRLRSLDGRFQQHFAQLTIRPRELHLTAGHRERSATGAEGDAVDARLSKLSEALTRSNIQSRQLGLAQGLANRVPEGTRAVAVVGPREPFLPEEAESLLRYVREGGRVVVFVDPDEEHGLEPLITGLGLSMSQGVLHSERDHVRRRVPPADRRVIFSNLYSAHPTVTLANRYRAQLASVMDGAGALDRREGEGAPDGLSVTFPLRTAGGFWLDRDGNHQADAGEPTEDRFHPMAAVTVANPSGEEGRAVIIADGDFITDAWIDNRGNAFVLMDTINWLVGEDQVLGPTSSEEDVPIIHATDEDKPRFYLTSFAAPLPLLLIGLWLAVRKTMSGGDESEADVEPREPAVAARPASPAPVSVDDAAPEPEADAAPDDDPEPEPEKEQA